MNNNNNNEINSKLKDFNTNTYISQIQDEFNIMLNYIKRLEDDVTNLKRENTKLKKENKFLKKYIKEMEKFIEIHGNNKE